MDCTRCEELLLERAEAPLEAHRAADVERHLEGCARCREFALLMREEAEGGFAAPEGFAELVLADTSDRMARIMARLEADLPGLAEGQVDERFVDDVMAATVVADRNRLFPRLARLWESLVARPRLAFEGAYAAALAVFLLFALPASPLGALPRSALQQLTAEDGPVRVVSTSARTATELGRDALARAGQLISERTATVSSADVRSLATSALSRIRREAGVWLAAIRDSALGRTVRWLLSPWLGPADDDAVTLRSPSTPPAHERGSDDRVPDPA